MNKKNTIDPTGEPMEETYTLELTQSQAYAIKEILEKGLREIDSLGNDLDTLTWMAQTFTEKFHRSEQINKVQLITRNYVNFNQSFSMFRHELNATLENTNALCDSF